MRDGGVQELELIRVSLADTTGHQTFDDFTSINAGNV